MNDLARDAGYAMQASTVLHAGPVGTPMNQAASNGGKVLVVDDVTANVDLLTCMLRREGYAVVTAHNGDEALDAVAREHPDLVLLDVVMPKRSGLDVCQELKRSPATRLMPVVLVTALQDTEDKIRGINAGADDFLTKPFNPHELKARVRSLVRLKRYTDDLESAESVIVSLALTIEARDANTEGHCERLASYAVALGSELGLPADDLAALHRGGFLHDVGKVGISDAVLLKRGPLTSHEFELMKQHTVIGERLCGELRSLTKVRPIVRHHHERLDGSGYPDGLKGDEIPLLAQILTIVDIYDALTTVRPYKVALTPERAYEELVNEAARGWRRRHFVDTFIGLGRRGILQPLAGAAQGALGLRISRDRLISRDSGTTAPHGDAHSQ